jgi:hypothetical protein
MRIRNALLSGVSAIAITGLAEAGVSSAAMAQQPAGVTIDTDDIGGVVTGPAGPEAGVWVIAETTDLPTRYTKSVVTDENGRTSSPICRSQIIRCSSVAMVWSIRPACGRSRGRC